MAKAKAKAPAKKAVKKVTTKKKVVDTNFDSFDWDSVGDNVRANAERIAKNVMANAQRISDNVAEYINRTK